MSRAIARATAARWTRAAAVIVITAGLLSLPSHASGAATLANETFTHATVPAGSFELPTVPSGTNVACLTAGSSSGQAPIPGCALSTPDADGSGALRFTDASTNKVGGAFSTVQLTTSDAPDLTFDSFQYGGNGADGISFVLAAADPAAPTPPSTTGPAGGHLGYSGGAAAPVGTGLPNGWLGIGLDAYGNYSTTGFNGTGCTPPSWQPSVKAPNEVTVRGGGNGNVGYCAIASSLQGGTLAGALSGGAAGTRSGSRVAVEIAINPTAGSLTARGGVTVPANSFLVSVTPIGASAQTIISALPSTTNGGIPAGTIPAADINPATGYPYVFYSGWEGSTGGSFDAHEIQNLVATALAGPVLTMTATDSDGGNLPRGTNATYTLTAGVAAGGGSEGQSITVTDTFPSGLTPTAASGTGWICTVSSQTVTCTYAVLTSAPLAAGTVLPAISVTTAVGPTASLSPGGLDDNATASSPNAVPVTATDVAQAVQTATSITASATPSSVPYGTSSVLAATGLPVGATGTVTFTSGGVTLCTANLPATSCPTSVTLPGGNYPITATYSGDANYTGSTATTNLTVTAVATVFTASATPPVVSYGTSSTLAETGLAPNATGTVTFTSGGVTLCTATLPATTCPTSVTLPAGNYPITATYSGDGNYAGSTASTNLTVNTQATTFTVSATPASVPYGTSSTLAESGLPSAATGTVTFMSGGVTLCVATLPATTCPTSVTLPAGSYPVTATYSGDANYAGSTATTNLTVTPIPTTTTVVSDLNPSGVGQGVTFTATVGPRPDGGTVTFTDNGAVITGCSNVPVNVSTGVATCTATSLTPGSYAIGAAYNGDNNYLASSSATGAGTNALTQVVQATVPTPVAGVRSGGMGTGGTLGGVLVLFGLAGIVISFAGRRRRPALPPCDCSGTLCERLDNFG